MTTEPQIFQAMAVRRALKMYAETKMKVNRLYTPVNMLRTATHITNIPFKRGQYQQAIDALTVFINEATKDKAYADPDT